MWHIIPGVKHQTAVNITRDRQIGWHARHHRDNYLNSWSKTWWGGGWRGMEEQSLTVQRKAEEDQVILYTLLWWPLPFCHPVLYSCIRSITKTHKRGHTHTHTHTHTNTPRRVTSGWQKMLLVGKIRAKVRAFSLLSNQFRGYLLTGGCERWALLVRLFTHKLKLKKDTKSQVTQHMCRTNKSGLHNINTLITPVHVSYCYIITISSMITATSTTGLLTASLFFYFQNFLYILSWIVLKVSL